MAFKLPNVGKKLSRQWGGGPGGGAIGEEYGRLSGRFTGPNVGSQASSQWGQGPWDPFAAEAGRFAGSPWGRVALQTAANPLAGQASAASLGMRQAFPRGTYGRRLGEVSQWAGSNPSAALSLALTDPTLEQTSSQEQIPGTKAYEARKDRERQEALQQARQAMLLSGAMGLRGGAQYGAGAQASGDYVAQLRAQADQQRAQQDAQSMQTLQSLMMLMGLF